MSLCDTLRVRIVGHQMPTLCTQTDTLFVTNATTEHTVMVKNPFTRQQCMMLNSKAQPPDCLHDASVKKQQSCSKPTRMDRFYATTIMMWMEGLLGLR